MDGLLIFAVIIPILLIVGSIMGMTAHGRIGRLEAEVKKQSQRILWLSKQLEKGEGTAQTAQSEDQRTAETIPPNPQDIQPAAEQAPTQDDVNNVWWDSVTGSADNANGPAQSRPAQSSPAENSPADDTTERAAQLRRRASERAAALRQSAGTVKKPKITSRAASLSKNQPKSSFEETIGAQWSVWVGGLALAIGTLFLLRYTIEAGVFSPAMRVSLAALLGIVLLAVGEVLRRKDGQLSTLLAALQNLSKSAYIPGVLTAVGIVALLGSSYAAYALYGFIGPLPAFVLFGGIALGGLFLGLLHGPKIAALGLIAALVTPLLITTTTPQYLALFAYLLIVGAAALMLAQRRDWTWMSFVTLFALLGWGLLSMGAEETSTGFVGWCVYLGLCFAANIYIARQTEDLSLSKAVDKAADGYGIWASLLWTAGVAALFFVMAGRSGFDLTRYGVAFAAGLGFVVMGAVFARHKWTAAIGAGLNTALVLGLLGYTLGGIDTGFDTQTLAMGSTIVMTLALLLTALKYICTSDKAEAIIWAVLSVAMPMACVFAFMPYVTGLSPNDQALMYGGLAIVFALSTEVLWRKQIKPPYPSWVYAAAAAAAYTMAMITAFSGLKLSVALILPIALVAGLYRLRPLWILRPMVVGFAGLTLLHEIFIHVLPGEVGTTLILNKLWLYLALPAALSAAAAWLLSREKSDLWSEGMKAFALTFTALFFIFQIHHFMNAGQVTLDRLGFDELALQVLVGFSVSLGGALINRGVVLSKESPAHERIMPFFAAAVSCISLALFALGICLVLNPLVNGSVELSGGLVLNSLLLGYLIPAIILGAVAYLARARRPAWYLRLTGGLSLLSLMIYISAMIRRGFNGADISVLDNWPRDAEMYTISAAWLLLGIALLALGIKSKRVDVRAASAVVIVLTVLKAFLIDMASLEGVLRAVSFVVLGVVLIVIGRVYQRFMFTKSA